MNFLMNLMIFSTGFWKFEDNEKYKGFYKKIWKLFEKLLIANNNISDKLLLNKILN